MKKKVLSLALALVMCLGLTIPAMAEEWVGDFTVHGSTLVGYYGDGGAITIPDGVTAIGDQAFLNCQTITSVTIPDSVTSIGISAFNGCTNLASVTIPASVTTIYDSAFCGCANLTSVTIPSGITAIGKRMFYGCQSLQSVTIPEGITAIGDNAFSECTGLTNVTIPDSVTTIGSAAFFYCTSLTSVTIPNGVTTIENAAFAKCESLSSVTMPDSVTMIGSGGSGGYGAFHGCTSLTSVTIPSGVTTIGEGTFSGCTGLTSMTIPSSVNNIWAESFQSCSKLADIYYAGSKAQWKAARGELAVEHASSSPTVHFNSTGPAAQPAAPSTPAQTGSVNAAPTAATVLVDGKNVSFDAYNIDGSNYFKLRDLAYVLNGTAKQFEVGWDNASQTIALTSGQSYTAAGGEMSAKGSGSQTARASASKILVDGKELSLTAYNIGGNNYFKLRDIGQAFDFGIGWDSASQTITIDTSTGYTA